MRQVELVRFHPVATRQHPAGKPLLDIVEAVARGRLGRLHQKALDVSLQVIAQLTRTLKLLFQNVCLDAETRTCDLDECPPRGRAGAEQNRNANHAVNPDDADLNRVSVGNGDDHGRNAVFQEVAVRGLSVEQSFLLY